MDREGNPVGHHRRHFCCDLFLAESPKREEVKRLALKPIGSVAMRRLLIVALVMASALAPSFAGHHRSRAATAEFKRLHPCPATGQPRGHCPGWVIDHVVPICAGGPDHHGNMQRQTVADAKVKDRAEAAQCNRLRTVVHKPKLA